MRITVLCLADQVERAADPRATFYALVRKAWEAEGGARMFLLDRNAKLATELRERGVRLWDE